MIDDTGSDRPLAPNALLARLSPDGNRVAYAIAPNTIQVVSIAGEEITSLRGAFNPTWSADGQKLVFVSSIANFSGGDSDNAATTNIKILDVSTGEQTALTNDQTDYSPTFDPSGRWIIFLSGRSGIASFWEVPVSGGTPRQLTNLGVTRVDDQTVPTPYKTVTWSPDGASLAFDTLNEPSESIWILRFDPSLQHVVSAKRVGTGLIPQWLDRDHIAALVNGERVSVLEVSQ